ncbi:YdeI/OmpD-associated family protein [Catellatospora sp. KI3]|uniref:YdeI/OmpD-associated family protein n=1 Tax=Catellatospora sp. KI3 TaxID=3041620 RepID=UPI002482CF74|nr:YdeI/OmpD-associated family protein [Catellatospora sp. KI3]MDI1465305.1 YdeI/OmpD-associated family protein [Catellatospora sp. KI3]
MGDEAEIVEFGSAAEFEQWVAAHPDSPGIWLKLAKGVPGALNYAQALDVALCHGWIDGQKRALDESYWLQKFTPRRARSRWSKINRDKVEALIAAGRMRPAGLAEIERARGDGRWDAAYDSPRTAQVPDDLAEALAAAPAAAAFFATLNSANRFAILHRIQDAKKPETRARRIAQYVAMCAEGRKIYP